MLLLGRLNRVIAGMLCEAKVSGSFLRIVKELLTAWACAPVLQYPTLARRECLRAALRYSTPRFPAALSRLNDSRGRGNDLVIARS